MYDIRDTRPWFWILLLIILGVAVAGLVVAISAKNSTVDERKLVNDATAQIKEELSGLNGALKAADELQKEADKAVARERGRIKRTVARAEAGAESRLRKLNARFASLEAEIEKVEGRNQKLRKNVAALNQGQVALAAEVATINRRLDRLFKNGGT
jgi:chromosome segregation ATPase